MQQLTPSSRIYLTAAQMDSMRSDVSSRAPQEACGLLTGKRSEEMIFVDEVYAIENALHSSVRYQLDPQQQVDVFLSVEKRGLEVVGIYHSHPEGPDHPSETDLEEAYYPEVVYLIWFHQAGDWECRCFSIQGKIITPVELMISKNE
jgi:proteasome lid subunit RPN8/RPN11